jgi:putative NADH-flavin reductase
MKQILVFGATVGTGKELVKLALDKGFEVSAVIRKPDGFDMKHKHLKIVKGDVMLPATFANEIHGKEAVISCLGTGSSTKQTTVYSKGI